MGCIIGKPSAIEDSRESPRERLPNKELAEARGRRLNSLRREERGDVKVVLIDKKANSSVRVYDEDYKIEKEKRERSEVLGVNHPGMGSVPKASEGEQVAAGWPSWLAAVAGEAIKGWIPRRADTFEKLDKIGQGTYSNVYKGRDVTHGKLVALKKVRFDYLDPESVKFMAREILVLRRLDHPNIIKLEGLVTSRKSFSLYLVFEYMEHDLTGLGALPGCKFTEPQIKCYMKQLLSGLDHCHSHGVLHRDIKGSNLLIDNNGILKIADFGLASFFDPHRSLSMTSRVVTLWYRPPELLLGAIHYGVSVDLWSTGCILAELYAGKPIMPGRTEVEQLHKIFKLCGSPSDDFWRKSKLPHSTVFKPQQPYRRCVAETFKDFPPAAVELMETLLSIDPAHRGTADAALKSEFFTTKPLACEPSSLPAYPPSKEIDAKLREEEARRQGAGGDRCQRVDQERRGHKESRAVAAPNANAELVMSMQKRQGHSNSNSRSETFYRHQEEAASGFPIGPPRQSQGAKEVSRNLFEHHSGRVVYSGPLVHGAGWAKAGKKHDDLPMAPTRADLATLSGLVAARTLSSEDRQEKPGPSKLEPRNQISRCPGSVNELGKQEWKYHNQLTEDSHRMEDVKGSTKEPILQSNLSDTSKMYFSGPLLVTSNNVDQMLKDRDRKVQERDRRARFEKMKVGKYKSQGKQQARGNPPKCVPSNGVR